MILHDSNHTAKKSSKQHPRYKKIKKFTQKKYIESRENQEQMVSNPNTQAPLPLMSLSLNPTPQQAKAWPDFVRREIRSNEASKTKFTRSQPNYAKDSYFKFQTHLEIS